MSEGYSIRFVDDPGQSWPHYPGQVENKSPNQLDKLSDTQIWELFRQGQEIAFIHIYKHNFDHLFLYGSQFTRNEALIEDAIQDMFIELREKRKNNTIRSSIRNYLFTCLRRRILLYKEKFENKLEPLEDGTFKSFEISVSIEQRIIESQIREDQKEKLQRGLKLLTPRQREAIYYLYNEGMDYSEIKDLMHFSNIRSTRNLIYRALDTIKSSLLTISILSISILIN